VNFFSIYYILLYAAHFGQSRVLQTYCTADNSQSHWLHPQADAVPLYWGKSCAGWLALSSILGAVSRETKADQASIMGNILQWQQPGDCALFSCQALLQTASRWHFRAGLTVVDFC